MTAAAEVSAPLVTIWVFEASVPRFWIASSFWKSAGALRVVRVTPPGVRLVVLPWRTYHWFTTASGAASAAVLVLYSAVTAAGAMI